MKIFHEGLPLQIFNILFLCLIVNVFAAPKQLVFPDDERKWFHNETAQCYVSGKQGPCPSSMIFYRVENTSYGDCDCPRPKGDFGSGPVSVYDVASNQCYNLFTKAFCSRGEWLVIDNKGNVSCVHNPCRSLQRKNPELNEKHPVVYYNKTCVRIEDPNDEAGCPSPYEIAMDHFTGLPICTRDPLSSYDISVKRRFACRPGTKRDRLGQCRQIHQVSFKP